MPRATWGHIAVGLLTGLCASICVPRANAQELVKDIWPGAGHSRIGPFASMGGAIFFAASDSVHGHELWRSDGTADGTVLVKDVASGTSEFDSLIEQLLSVNGTLYFTAFEEPFPFGRRMLWKSDGTAEGTDQLIDIVPTRMYDVGGTLYFAYGTQLWKSDGSESGTLLVKDIAPGRPYSELDFLTLVNGTVFFRAIDEVYGVELWKSDGTESGTVLVKDISTAGDSWPHELTEFQNALYFVAREDILYQLWRSDGTASGTTVVKDTLYVPSDPFITPLTYWSNLPDLTSVNETLFFVANDGVHGQELWKSDGTPEGTVLVKDVNPGAAHGGPDVLMHSENRIYFTAYDDVHGRELWVSDGTPEGTSLVKDIYPGAESGLPNTMVNVGGVMYFSANAGDGYRLWKTDGTESGTVVAADLDVGCRRECLHFAEAVAVGDTLYFTATDSAHGRELWKLTASPTDVEGHPSSQASWSLSQPYPNPFRDTTTLTLSATTSQEVTVALYDVLGRRVRTLYRTRVHASIPHEFTVDGSDLSSGIYLVLFQGTDFRDSRLVTVVR